MSSKKRMLSFIMLLIFGAGLAGIVLLPLLIPSSDAQRIEYTRLKEIPERFKDIPTLLEDYQAGAISTNFVIKVILLRAIEDETVFLLFRDTDTYTDLYAVHKATHQRQQEAKKTLYMQMEQRAR